MMTRIEAMFLMALGVVILTIILTYAISWYKDKGKKESKKWKEA